MSEFSPKISVIVNIYNAEKTLERAVDSLLNQTLKDIEIILVDDGSSDNSASIIDSYASKYQNIVAFHNDNMGVSGSRNFGLSKISADYFGFLDSDDYALPDMFEKLYKKISEEDCDLVLCGYREVFTGSLTYDRNYEGLIINNACNFITEYIKENVGAYLWNKLYKTEIIKNNGVLFNDDVIIGEDVLFLFDYLKYAKQISVISECLYEYLRNDTSICAKYYNNMDKFYITGYTAIENTLDYLKIDDEQLKTNNRINLLKTLLWVLDNANSRKNKTSLKARYYETKKIANGSKLNELIINYGDNLTLREEKRKIKYIKSKKMFCLFVYEVIRMRIIAGIMYYIG